MRIVAWNIRAGGGQRVGRISRYLERWAPDAVVLSEFRATPPSLELARSLASHGLSHQCTSASRRNPRANALLVAARWPVSPLRLRAQPREPGRWLLVSVNAPRPLLLGAMHVPNRVTGRKYRSEEHTSELQSRENLVCRLLLEKKKKKNIKK